MIMAHIEPTDYTARQRRHFVTEDLIATLQDLYESALGDSEVATDPEDVAHYTARTETLVDVLEVLTIGPTPDPI